MKSGDRQLRTTMRNDKRSVPQIGCPSVSNLLPRRNCDLHGSVLARQIIIHQQSAQPVKLDPRISNDDAIGDSRSRFDVMFKLRAACRVSCVDSLSDDVP